MRRTASRTLLGFALAGVICLSGCSDGKSDASSPDAGGPASSAGLGAPDETPTGPADEPLGGSAPAESDPGDDESGDKPSRDEVIEGYRKVITTQSPVELPADIVEQTAACFVDAIYDQASAQTLQALAQEDATGIDPADTSLFSEASVTCTKEVVGQ